MNTPYKEPETNPGDIVIGPRWGITRPSWTDCDSPTRWFWPGIASIFLLVVSLVTFLIGVVNPVANAVSKRAMLATVVYYLFTFRIERR